MEKRHHILFAIFLFPYFLLAQSGMKIEHFTEEDGLPHRWVSQIIQDKYGFIWMATAGGLCRYDGHEFRLITMPKEEGAEKKIRSIQESKDGMIWVRREDDTELRILNPHTFESRIAQPKKERFVLNEDESRVIYGYHVYYSDVFAHIRGGTPRRKTELSPLIHGLKISGNETIITKNGKEEVWFWHSHQYYWRFPPMPQNYTRYNILTDEFEAFKLEEFLNLTFANSNLPIDTEGRFWFPNPDKNTGQIFNFFRVPDGIPLDKWQGMRVDNRLNIWIYTNDFDLFRFDIKRRELERIGKVENQRMEVYEDREGTIWIGTENGLRKIRRRKRLFENYLDKPVILGEPPPFGKSIYQIIEPLEGIFFTMHSTRNIFQIDANSKQTKRLGFHGGELIPAEKNYFYIFRDSRILEKVNVNSLEIQQLDHERNATKYTGDIANCVFLKSTNNGLFMVNTVTEKIEKSDKFYKWKQEYGMYDKSKNLHWANHKKGILKINLTDLSEEYIELWAKKNEFFIRSWHSLEDSLWLGTLDGLKLLDLKTNQIIQNYTTEDGLPHNTIYSIIKKGENFWMGTHSGLCAFNPKTKEVRNFYVEDGLTHNEFNSQSVHLASDGKIWMGGLNGLNVFNSEDLLKIKPDSADLFLTKFRRDNIEQDTFITIENIAELMEDQQYKILPSDFSFTFQFFLNILAEPSKHQYYWYLEGHESPWSNVDSKPIAKYQNVPPGNYILRVKAADKIGNFAKNELAISIEVLQIWYKRWWAWLMYLLILISGVFAFYKFQINRRLEQEEALRLKELDTLKTKLYTNITHEFRTPLTVISGMAEQIKNGQHDSEEKAEMISRNSQNLLDLVNQMLDLSKLESGKMNLNYQKADVISFLRYLLESFQSFAQSKNIRIHLLTDLKGLEMDFDRDKLKNVVVNLISNALKFTKEGGDIYCELNQKTENLIIKIKDTGIGISEEKLPHIFDRFYQIDDSQTREGEGTGIGLALIKELVKLMKGDISVKSELGVGTEFLVQLPLVRNEIGVSKNESATTMLGGNFKLSPNLIDLEQDKSGENLKLPPASENRSTLLVIEDNSDVTKYIQTLLQKDYEILTAPNGEIGIEKAIEVTPDIIISDVMMPKKDGFEVVQTLKNDERTSHIPIILLTAKADIQSKLEGLERGADAYLAKPFNQKELEIRLLKLLELRRNLQKRYSKFSKIEVSKPAENRITDLEHAFLQKLHSIIEKNLSNSDFDMNRLGRSLAMSRSQVYRKVKALTGQSPAVFIRSFRLQKGKKLLTTTDMTASEVAYEVGFSSLSYFSNAFFEEFGVRPSGTSK